MQLIILPGWVNKLLLLLQANYSNYYEQITENYGTNLSESLCRDCAKTRCWLQWMYWELYDDNSTKSKCCALQSTFLPFLSAALANKMIKIARQQR